MFFSKFYVGNLQKDYKIVKINYHNMKVFFDVPEIWLFFDEKKAYFSWNNKSIYLYNNSIER